MMSEESVLIQPRRNFFALLWGMIRHPHATLEYVDQTGGRTWVIMALLAAVSAVFLVVAIAPISARIAQEAMQTQLQSQSGISPGGDDAEMQARISQFATNPLLTIVAPSLTGVIGIFIGWLVWAGALHLISVMVGGDSHFGGMWRGVVWSYLPVALRNGLQSIYVLATGELIANQGLSGFVAVDQTVSELIASPPSAGRLALRSLLAQIDLFNIWNLVLLVIAVMTIARLSRRKAIGITLGVWGALMVVRVLAAIVPTLFASGLS
jgi:hypothetical protein